jgi:hypothetical protein
MSLYERQKSRMGNISRTYNFVNSNNGGMGVQDFFNRFIVNRNRPIIRPIRPIIKEIFDLSIYIILDNNIKFDLKTILSNVDSKHKIKTNSYSNNSNINLIQNEIKNELNESLIIIDKNSNLEFFRKLLIPYIIYDELNENINEEWISDKTRFFYDALVVQRLGIPLFLNFKIKQFKELSWEKSFNIFLVNIYKSVYNLDNKLNIIFGNETDLETILTVKHLFNKLNCFSLYSTEFFCNNSLDLIYKLDGQMKNINEHDLCVIVNCDTRLETSMLNLHLRKAVLQGSLNVGYFGPSIDLTFEKKHLGFEKKKFFDLLKWKNIFCK